MENNSYILSRNWFNWSFDNPEKITPAHTAVYFFAIEHHNRLGWKEKFGFPSQMVMEAIGIRSWNTYIKVFNDLVEWGFFNLIEKSKNQYSSNVISLVSATSKNDKALDKALTKHVIKQQQSTHESIDSIDKQTNKQTNKIYVEKKFSTPSDKIKDLKSKKEKTGYKEFIQTYFEFYFNLVGVEYKFTNLDGKAAKGMLTYLEKVSKNKDPIESWKYILNHFDQWDQFYQKQLKLNQIESNLPNILDNIKNGYTNKKHENANYFKLTKDGYGN